jgi:hypothetical protein
MPGFRNPILMRFAAGGTPRSYGIGAAIVGTAASPVVGAVKRKGNVIARVVENVRADTLCEFVRDGCWLPCF